MFLDASASAPDVAWRLALVGVGNGLFAGPNSTEILTRTPAELTGTSSGVTSLLRTLGFSLGPAIGARAWAMMSGGTGGFVLGVLVVAAASAVAVLTTALSRPDRREDDTPNGTG